MRQNELFTRWMTEQITPNAGSVEVCDDADNVLGTFDIIEARLLKSGELQLTFDDLSAVTMMVRQCGGS